MLGLSFLEMVLLGFVLWLVYGVIIACLNPTEAPEIIKATGRWFPLRPSFRWPRKRR